MPCGDIIASVKLSQPERLLLQQVLTDPQWLDKMTAEDYRALSPLLHQHVTPYGLFALDMSKHIPLEQTTLIGRA